MRRRAIALLALLAASGCGSEAPAPAALPTEGPLALLVIESEGRAPLEVKGPRVGELPADRREARGELWRLATLYGQRADTPGAVLEAVLEDGTRVPFPVRPPAPAAGEVLVLRDPKGRWHVLVDPPASPPGAEAHGVTGLRLRVTASAERPAHGRGGRRGTGGGAMDGSGGGAMDGSGGGR